MLLVHLPFALFIWQWSAALEPRVISFPILFFITADFVWFAMNPAFGLRNFRREPIWWHAPTWWWIMSRDYWVFTTVGIAAYIMAATIQ